MHYPKSLRWIMPAILLLTLFFIVDAQQLKEANAESFAPGTTYAIAMSPGEGQEVFATDQIGNIVLWGNYLDGREALLINGNQQSCKGTFVGKTTKSITFHFACDWYEFEGKNSIWLATDSSSFQPFHFSLSPIGADGAIPGSLPAGYRVHH